MFVPASEWPSRDVDPPLAKTQNFFSCWSCHVTLVPFRSRDEHSNNQFSPVLTRALKLFSGRNILVRFLQYFRQSAPWPGKKTSFWPWYLISLSVPLALCPFSNHLFYWGDTGVIARNIKSLPRIYKIRLHCSAADLLVIKGSFVIKGRNCGKR